MRQDKFSRQNILLYCLGMIPVTWLALLIAPYMEGGLAGLIRNFGPAMENPFHIVLLSCKVFWVRLIITAHEPGLK